MGQFALTFTTVCVLIVSSFPVASDSEARFSFAKKHFHPHRSFSLPEQPHRIDNVAAKPTAPLHPWAFHRLLHTRTQGAEVTSRFTLEVCS
jgi:hypothetical protein